MKGSGRWRAWIVAVALIALAAMAVSPLVAGADGSTGRIVGKVTSKGAPVAGINVQITSLSEASQWSYITGDDGSYVSDDLPNGDYQVCFQDENGVYATQWWNGQDQASLADTATVNGADFTADASLDLAGHITGTVVLPATAGDVIATVTAYRKVGTTYEQALTTDCVYDWASDDTTQTYDLALPPGEYRLGFQTVDTLPQFYPGVTTIDPADVRCQDVAVSSEETVTGIDATLSRGGHIVMKVVGPRVDGHIVVTTDSGEFVQHMWLDEAGPTMTIDGLFNREFPVLSSTGKYKIHIYPATNAAKTSIKDQYYNLKYSASTANTVNVTDGADTKITMTLARPTVKVSRTPSKSSLTYTRKHGRASFTLTAAFSAANLPLGSQKVFLQTSTDGKKWKYTYALKTYSTGRVSKKITATRKGLTYYRWCTLSNTSHDAGHSSTCSVRIK